MSLRIYLFFMSLGTLLCWIAWFFVLTNVSPDEGGLLGLIFFYSSLFLAIMGTASVVGCMVKKAREKNDDVVFRHVHQTFRQSIYIAAFVIVMLVLKAAGLLSWWVLLALLATFFILEGMTFTSRKI